MLPVVSASRTELVSHAPDHTDVVVLRALGDAGRYVELADAPLVTRAPAERGWHGAVVRSPADPGVGREDRTRETVVARLGEVGGPVHLAVTSPDDDVTPLAPWLALVAAHPEGRTAAEAALERAGYVPGVFDGSYRFWVSPDHLDLLPAVSYPACSRDAFVTAEVVRLRSDRAELRDAVSRWRVAALTSWAGGGAPAAAVVTGGELAAARAEAAHWHSELAATHRTLSWRVTRPLRAVRRRTR